MYRYIRIFLIIALLLLGYIVVLLPFRFGFFWLVYAAIAIVMLCKRGGTWTAFGSARWATINDIPHLLETGNGLILGYIEGKPSRIDGVRSLFNSRIPARVACRSFLQSWQNKPPVHLVRLNNAVHTVVFAPTGVGKGVSCIVPYLLACPESCVVIDPKGENYRLSANARRRMGHKVIRLDPFGVCGPDSDTFNPLLAIDRESFTAIDECRDLAEALVLRTGQEKDPHWNDAAEIWIAAMIAMVVAFAEGDDKNLQSCRALLTSPDKMQAAIKMMCESEDIWEGMLSRLGHQLTHFKDKELASTLTSTNRFMRFLDTIAIFESTRKSSFDPADLLTGKMTVYLILPPEHLRAQSPLLRLWIGSMLRAVVKGGLQEKIKVHFILDESASLGHMAALDDAVDKYRGYGVRLQFYYQSLGQLKKCWPDGQDQTLLSNTHQVFFGVNDPATADFVSTRLGESTLIISSGGTSEGSTQQRSQHGADHSYSKNVSENWQQHGRRLLKPEEVMTLDQRVAITFTPGAPPIATVLARYYEAGFDTTRGMGRSKMIFQTICFFFWASLSAVMFTMVLTHHTFR
jgi:type IV secretion system protein VirD4